MRYFAASDLHGFADEAKEALGKAGYDPSDPGHFLVACGDVFDRGPDPRGIMSFLRSLPPDRLALVRGNHEDLMLELASKPLPEGHDVSNGTADTVTALAGMPPWREIAQAGDYELAFESESAEAHALCEADRAAWAEAVSSPAVQDMLGWLRSPAWRDFLETRTHVCVHAGIPLGGDWREASAKRWAEARWDNPAHALLFGGYDAAFAEGKKVVAGHWRTSDVFRLLRGIRSPKPPFPEPIGTPYGESESCPAYDDGQLVCIDACTALTGRVNVYSWEE